MAMRSTSRPARLVRATLLLLHLVVVWLAAVVLAPRIGSRGRRALVQRFARQTLAILHVRVRCRGVVPGPDATALVVANHVSWLDVYALNAVRGSSHVAKAEVRAWPLAGAIARGFATIFHVRGHRRDAARAKDGVAARLRTGEPVVVFPEGTTTDGAGVLRFHPAFFQAAVDTGMPVQPVAIRYCGPDARRDPAAAFVGDMTFVASLLRVLRRPALDAELVFGPVLSSRGRARRELATRAEAFVAETLAAAPPASASFRRAA